MGEGQAIAALRDQADAWLRADPDPETRAELAAVLDRGDAEGLVQLFDGHLSFGTAGLRAPMGPGPRRMNRLVVRRTTAGLLAALPSGARVVIGYDARKNSDVFARDAARVVAAAGGRAYVWPCPVPTPLVAFAVRMLGADAGVVCTASHNPASDNGFKVYASDGAQLIPPADAEIAAAIERITRVPIADHDDPRIELVDSAVEDAYLMHVGSLVPHTASSDGLVIVYSPLHGVGASLTLAAFERVGHPRPHVVAEQFEPDPTFRTVVAPNPEEPGAISLALAQAEREGADIALVQDPDADRLGVLVPIAGSWRPLTGNEIGLLLADHILDHTSGDDRLVVDTIVSSTAIAELAAARGVHHARTLTGFKWIVRPAIEHPQWRFVFGYEEALGFSVDPYVRDKDSISASLMIVDLLASLRERGETIEDRLRALAVEHGLFTTDSWTLRARDHAELTRSMERLRATPLQRIGNARVIEMIDYWRRDDEPRADLLEFRLENRTRVSVRPSGTEPKLKVYAEVVSVIDDGLSYDQATSLATGRLEPLRDALGPVLESLLAG
jgi:phosphomannomutase